MGDRSISARPSSEQVVAIVDFMEKHPELGLGQLRGLEGREESKVLWMKLTRIVNNLSGPTRPMKSWIKYWADKKSTVRSKVTSSVGDSNNLSSNIEKRIWDLFLSDDAAKPLPAVKQESNYLEDSLINEDYMACNHVETNPVLAFESRRAVKQESNYLEDSLFNEDSMECNNVDTDPVIAFDNTVEGTTSGDVEDRQMAIMEKLVKVMGDQASALSQLAHASQVNAQAMDRLAEASQIQARAIDRLANSFESIGAATHDVRNAIIDIDVTMKRYYNTSPT